MKNSFGLCLKNTIFLLVVLGSTIFPIFAQNAIPDVDYIILSNGRRLDGSLLRSAGQLNFEKIDFLRRGETISYSPGELEAFGLGSGEYFMSLALPDSPSLKFVQVLASGPVWLFRYQGVFYAGTSQELQKLGETGSLKKNNQHEEVLMKLMTGECLSQIRSTIKGVDLEEVDLVWLFTKYYDCLKNENTTIYGQIRPELVWSKVIGVTAYSSGINSKQVSEFRKDVLTLSPVIQVQGGIRLHQIRKYPKLSAEAAFAYEFFGYESDSRYQTINFSYSGTQKMRVTMLSIPLQLNYQLAKQKRSEYYVGGGLGMAMSRTNSTYAIRDQQIGAIPVVSLEEGSFVSMKGTMVYYHGSVGGRFSMAGGQQIEVFMRTRFMQGYYSLKLQQDTSIYNRVEAGLGLNFIF